MTRATSPLQALRTAVDRCRSALPRRDERGVAYPSPLVALSIVAIAMAVIAFVATQQGPSGDSEVTTVSDSRPSPSATGSSQAAKPEQKKPKKPAPKPAVVRSEVLVEVYNNSGVSGLAGQTGAEVQGAGWQLVDTDNWYGTIPASTVYYGAEKKRAAELLAQDLGISRVLPAVDPMRGDRLTVILTGDRG